MFDKLKGVLGLKKSEAPARVENQFTLEAATLPPMPPLKAPKGLQTYPAFRQSVVPRTSAISRTDRQLANTDRLTFRNQTTTPQVVRELMHASPELSSATSLLIRTGIPEGYRVFGRNLDGQVDRDITLLAQELLRRITFLGNADGSFGNQASLQSTSESIALELLQEGAACVEVALDKALVPASLQIVAVKTLEFFDEDKGFRLTQKIGQEVIDLDIPTVIYTAWDQEVTQATPSSYMEAAIQTILADIEFNNDMRRALKRAVLPRMVATIDAEKVIKSAPVEIQNDPEKLAEYMNQVSQGVQDMLNTLSPEDALTSYDSITYSFIEGGHDPSGIIERVQNVLNAKLSSGTKSLPVTLGFATTSNASGAESLLYIKQCDGLRRKLNEIYSRALSVAVRLMGVEGYVEFVYDSIDLRPTTELEAFFSQNQSRILDQLSLGLIGDEEASILLTRKVTPEGYVPLSGTRFRGNDTQVNANPTSNTSAIEQTLAPKTPSQTRGSAQAHLEIVGFK